MTQEAPEITGEGEIYSDPCPWCGTPHSSDVWLVDLLPSVGEAVADALGQSRLLLILDCPESDGPIVARFSDIRGGDEDADPFRVEWPHPRELKFSAEPDWR